MTNDVKTRIVYVPNKGPHDYTEAWKFGQLIFCTEGQLNRKDLLTMHSELSRMLEDSQPEDYILLTSLTSLCSIACAIFARLHGRLNLLIFEDGSYLERTLHL